LKLFIVGLLVVMFLGCASNFESRSGIKVNQSVMKNRNSLAGWLSYGMALAAWKPVNDTSGKLNFYEREVYARESTALIWQDLKKDGKKLPDPDLDALVLITKSGFIIKATQLDSSRWAEIT